MTRLQSDNGFYLCGRRTLIRSEAQVPNRRGGAVSPLGGRPTVRLNWHLFGRWQGHGQAHPRCCWLPPFHAVGAEPFPSLAQWSSNRMLAPPV